MTREIERKLAGWRHTIEEGLEAAIPPDEGVVALRRAMRHSLLAGGKRVRPLFVLAACETAGGDASEALAAALAVEMIHTYSLIHDDLPAMDDDELRRGRPTCHVVHGEALAILAGDALHTLAFETLAEAPLPPARIRMLVSLLAHAAGMDGMAGGQALDLAFENTDADETTVARIHQLKTGALIACCFEMGAVAAGAGRSAAHALGEIGRRVGLAFQIQDDVLDVTSDAQTLGKTAGKDREANKATWPAVVGLDRARRQADDLFTDALARIAEFGESAQVLEALVVRLRDREN
ncbi:MAG: polyprenyl synthetase family protein [Acidobacteriota bacterium]|nr:MAG: polyprenyl synthetase family protein [Acidobacteriota bacterium]